MEVSPRVKIGNMLDIDLSADDLVAALLKMSETETVCILDSCGVGHLGSHLLIAGIEPETVEEMSHENAELLLTRLDRKFSGDLASIFTLSYDLGRKVQGIRTKHAGNGEPDVYLAQFASLIVHDYWTGKTRIVGEAAGDLGDRLIAVPRPFFRHHLWSNLYKQWSDLTENLYIEGVEIVKERIRDGDTYQTNLTQQISIESPLPIHAQTVYQNLRGQHPAAFSAFIKRPDSTVISASPERFFSVCDGSITASPIKGTRRRGSTPEEDILLMNELLGSEKDLAENTMIVDLLRNDLGRVCKYGSVKVDSLCELEEHPTLFHLVSTISGRLSENIRFSDLLRSLFPCGSITGAPKLSTMRIIDDIEPAARGLSMGAIGYHLPGAFRDGICDVGEFDLSVAIRTMVIRGGEATFNVGGGVVIDSDPESEYAESLLKARALLDALSSAAPDDSRHFAGTEQR